MLQFTLIVLHVLAAQVVGAQYQRMCYFTNWSQYRQGDANYRVQDIDPSLCTHILFAFAGLDSNQLKTTEHNDDASYKAIVGLKTKNPDLKVLLSVGGATANLTDMSQMLSTPATRGTFVTSCVSVLNQYGFDGLDLDFEFPGKLPSIPQDKKRFGLLVQELKEAFVAEAAKNNKPPLLLTVVVSTYKPVVDKGYDVEKIVQYVDYILLLTYDYHGPWDKRTGHNSPLYEADPYGPFGTITNMNYGALYWVRLGAPKEKLIIGMAAYGRGFELHDPEQTGFGAPANASRAQEYTKEKGYMAYFEVCEYLLRDGENPTIVRSPVQQVPYFYRNSLWVGYDDKESLINKVRWLKMLGFGGYLVWDLSLDDARGVFCAQGPYPLLNALKNEVLADPVEPLPPPRYLLDAKCGPCVSKDSGYDCDQNDTSRYHECQDGLVVFTTTCPDESPAFDTGSDNCVNTAQTEESCQKSLMCGRAPEAQLLEASGIFGTLEPQTVSMTETTTPVKGSVVPVKGSTAGLAMSQCPWILLLLFILLCV